MGRERVVDLMVSELGLLYSSKILVLDNFSNTPSRALPPATRKLLHKTLGVPFTNHPGSKRGWALPQCRLCAPFHTPQLGHTSGARWGRGTQGSPGEALGFYHIPSVTSLLKKEQCHICSFSVNIF